MKTRKQILILDAYNTTDRLFTCRVAIKIWYKLKKNDDLLMFLSFNDDENEDDDINQSINQSINSTELEGVNRPIF